MKKILFLLLVVFTVSCQQDDSVKLEEQGLLIQSPKSEISYNEFLNKFQISSKVNNNLSNPLYNYAFGYPSNISNSKNENSIIHYIDTTNIIAYEFENIQTYTFNVVPTVQTQNVFYNIIFYQTNDGSYSKLLKYESDFDWINSEDIPFTGTVYEIEENETVINTYTTVVNGSDISKAVVEDCTFSSSIVNTECTGDGHEVGDTSCLCGQPGHSCAPAFSFEVWTLSCVYVPVGGGDDETPIDGGTVGSSPDNPYQNEDGTFNLPTGPVKGNLTWNSFLSSLNDSELAYINSVNLTNSIQAYLHNNYYSIKAINLVNAAIDNQIGLDYFNIFISTIDSFNNTDEMIDFTTHFINSNGSLELFNELVAFLVDNYFSPQAYTEIKLKATIETTPDNKWDETHSGNYDNNPKLAYDAIYVLSNTYGTEIMYRLTNGFVLYATPNQKVINPIQNTIVATDFSIDGVYHYMYDYGSGRWFEYGLPVNTPDCLSCDIDSLFQAFIENSIVITGRYILPVEDFVILFTGEDFYGVESSRAVAGGFILVELIPGASAVKALKFIKYGDEIVQAGEVIYKYVDDIYKAQRESIENVLADVDWYELDLFDNTIRKGNFGEMVTDVDLYGKGYEPLHNRVSYIDQPLNQGIDGVFQNPISGEYLIVETKYGQSSLSTLANGTKQMSDDWILGLNGNINRLEQEVGMDLADDIIDSGYTRILAKVSQNGEVVYYELNALGEIIDITNPWTP